MKILAGIITYNPDMELLSKNVRAISSQVDKVIIIDNHSFNVNILESSFRSNNVELKCLPQNVGVGSALNILLKIAKDHGFDYFLSLDQDSICSNNLIDIYKRYLGLPQMGILCCEIIQTEGNCKKASVMEVSECITSGCLYDTEIIYKIGGFFEELFIDCIDNDICKNLIKNGFKVYRIMDAYIKHHMGEFIEKKCLGKIFYIYSEPPMRHYYISRNWILLSRKYKENYLGRVLRIWAKTFILEPQKIKNTKATILGIIDGYRGVTGKLHRSI